MKTKSLAALIAELPGKFKVLVAAEIARVKALLKSKLITLGRGIAFLLITVVLGFLGLVWLFVSLMLVLAIWLPMWGASLITFGVLIIFSGVFLIRSLVLFARLSRPDPARARAEEIMNPKEPDLVDIP